MTETNPDTRVPRRWQNTVRAIWFAFAFLLIAISIAGIPAYFNELRTACLDEACPLLAISPQEANVLRDFGLALDFYAGYIIIVGEIIVVGTMALLAGLIFWRKSDDWMGLLVSLTLLLAINGLSNADDAFASLYPSLRLPYDILSSLAGVPIVLLLYLFPSGRFVPGWTRFVAIIFTGTALIDPILRASVSQTQSGEMSIFGAFMFLGCLAVGVVAQIYRFRSVSSPSQRQQTKWVVFGLTSLILSVFIWIPLVEVFPLQPGLARLTFNTIGFGLLVVPLILVFPISVFFSILRYRLWDIDTLINRALVYALLTGSLALVYFGSVMLLQYLFRAFTGQESQFSMVLSTLAIAALFRPLQRRIQDAIDRRFYRRKYIAEHVLSQFEATVRDEVDLDSLTGTLLTVVKETMQPEGVTLWLAESERYAPIARGKQQ
jgi:hypothetical protein